MKRPVLSLFVLLSVLGITLFSQPCQSAVVVAQVRGTCADGSYLDGFLNDAGYGVFHVYDAPDKIGFGTSYLTLKVDVLENSHFVIHGTANGVQLVNGASRSIGVIGYSLEVNDDTLSVNLTITKDGKVIGQISTTLVSGVCWINP